jgi:hypothetical protein
LWQGEGSRGPLGLAGDSFLTKASAADFIRQYSAVLS